MKPAIVLVHGAFAEPASWNNVIDSLTGAGHRVIAAPNPLRGPAADAAASGVRPLWREVPSWFLIGEQDHTIPAALQRFMAERAGAARAGDSRGVARGRRLAPRGDSRADPPGRGPARDRLTCACGWRSARQPAPRSPGTNHVTLEER
jgi:pimeloyl-ACP methyl ester carboxylesterase